MIIDGQLINGTAGALDLSDRVNGTAVSWSGSIPCTPIPDCPPALNGSADGEIVAAAQPSPTCPVGPLSSLSPDDRAMYGRLLQVLRQDYGQLGLTTDQFRNLTLVNNCLTNAMMITDPDPGMIGRPTLDGILSIYDLQHTPQGGVLDDFSYSREQNAKYKKMFETIRPLLVVLTGPGAAPSAVLLGIAKIFAKAVFD
jgi:hypothetical protein